jgi:phage terminase large subunit GpA-like protein
VNTALAQVWCRALAPVSRLTVSAWSARYRKLPEASAARGARWHNETAPYLVDIMDAAITTGVKSIAVQKSAQCGCSEALLNIIAYHIEHRPCPILFVLPTASVANDFAKERLADLLRATPTLGRLVSSKYLTAAKEQPESTLQLKLFPGGFLGLGGSNSPNVFARWSVRIAIGDDVDRWPASVGQEGDPGLLLQNRVQSFHDPLVIMVSTPVSARGRIATLYESSDQRRYHVPCPQCGRAAWLTWSDPTTWHVKFDQKNPTTARLQCPCGHRVYEPDRLALLRSGVWRATATALVAGAVGFHVSAMMSPFVTLQDVAAKFLASHQAGPTKLREFITTSLGQGWTDPRDRIDPEDLVARAQAHAF